MENILPPSTEAQAAPLQSEAIPTPPGGGRWMWDSDARQWVSQDPPVESAPQIQE